MRLLETGTFRRVGGVEPLQAEFRLVCATHRDLEQMVTDGQFRQDLYFRISVFPVTLPPLRERQEDLPPLIDSLLKRLAPGRRLQISDAALRCLQHYPFPGNIRELRNLLERALLLADAELLEPRHFPAACHAEPDASGTPPQFNTLLPLKELERRYLEWALSTHPQSKQWLANALGISERTLYRKIRQVADSG